MPVFEGLVPIRALDHLVQDLLYVLSTWHALAKYRLHTQTTVTRLDEATYTLGILMRRFRKETAALRTKELQKEKEARLRRVAKQAEKEGRQATSAEASSSPQHKMLNLFTYKLHALGDYVAAIRMFGTTDNYNTQIVSNHSFCLFQSELRSCVQGELEHRRVKRMYARTNKTRTSTAQITTLEMRYRRLQRIKARMNSQSRSEQDLLRDALTDVASGDPRSTPLHTAPHTRPFSASTVTRELMPQTSGYEKYQISSERRNPIVIRQLVSRLNGKDLAVKVSMKMSGRLEFRN
jgi:hypothetical protein